MDNPSRRPAYDTPETVFTHAIRETRPGSRTFRAHRAGRLVIRALANYLSSHGPRPLSARRLDRLHREVAAVPDGRLRRALTKIVEAMSGIQTVRQVVNVTSNYGEVLHRIGRFDLGAAVHNFVLQRAPEHDGFDFGRCHLRLGYCLRELGLVQAAEQQFEFGHAWALAHRDARAMLHLKMVRANLARKCGRLDEATTWLDEALASATVLADPEFIARASQERGILAHETLDWIAALGYYERTLDAVAAWAVTDARRAMETRHRVMNDIGVALRHLGLYDDARQVWIAVRLTATENFTRWSAAINLMGLAAIEGREKAFFHHDYILKRAPLAAHLRVTYLEERADGLVELGLAKEARATYRRLALLADKSGRVPSARYAFEALSGTVVRIRAIRLSDPPPEIARFVTEVRRLSDFSALIAEAHERPPRPGDDPPGKGLRRGRRPQ
jgi:tetratricopeptide (TPR) repeat protein